MLAQAIAQASAVVPVVEGARAGVVAVALEAIVHRQAHAVVTPAQGQLPTLAQFDAVLQVQANAAGLLLLAQGQRTGTATDLVVVAFTVIALLFKIDTGGDLLIQAEPVGLVRVLPAYSGEQPGVRGLPTVGVRQAVAKLAPPQPAAHLVAVVFAQVSGPVQRQALLGDVFVGVVQQALGAGLVTLGVYFGEGQGAGVFGAVVQRLEGDPQLPGIALPAQLAGEVARLGGGVLAIAVEVGDIERQQAAKVAGSPAGFGAQALVTVLTAADIDGRLRCQRRLAGLDRQHAASTVAVKRRGRAADHFDALHQAQINTVHFGLAIGHGQRHAIDQHANAAHAETRTRAKATNRQAHALGHVVAALRHSAGHCRKQGIKGQQLLAGLFGDVHGANGCRGLQPGGIDPRRSHFQRRQFDAVGTGATGAKQQEGHDGVPPGKHAESLNR
ncbi:hypothetical protein D3C77_205060 [compost metagenome]